MSYSKLLLSTGGGIVSRSQQADQESNTASVLIGLGGTGVDCIAKIKQSVYERLKPDDPNALVPTYHHIRFLAVDTDLDNKSITVFDPTNDEFFDISNSDIENAFKRKDNIRTQPQNDWLDPERADTASFSLAGAGGFRPAGRYMMMDKSNQFIDRVKKLIVNAKRDLSGANLNIHIFSGLAGGTGSGIFLDVCYMTRQAILEANGGNGKIFGYFFLPDVNLDRIPDSASLVKGYVPLNGYAAMQDLDYCMRLGENGGGFSQNYKGGKIAEWNCAPVDMCHLVSATMEGHNTVTGAYENAMCVVTEYVMDFLTKNNTASADTTGETKFSLISHFSNFRQQIIGANSMKQHGYHLEYCVIGAACASIPMRKINTYLAAKTFEAFSAVKKHVPSEKEVEELAGRAGILKIDGLLREIQQNVGTDLNPLPSHIDWEYVRDNDKGEKEMVLYYTDQGAKKKGLLEKNARSMMDEKNPGSLISRVCAQIDECAKTLNRGPSYAYGVIEAARSGNLLNLLDGLIRDVEKRYRQRKFNYDEQPDSIDERYKNSRQIWLDEKDNGILKQGKSRRAFDEYVSSVEDLNSAQIELEALEQLKRVLKNLKRQLKEKAQYYLKFSRVFHNLLDTFEENLNVLNSEKERGGADEYTFEKPLVTIDEIRETLDRSVKEKNMGGLLSQFVEYLLADDGIWREENEGKITNAVRDFFLNEVFTGWAQHTITQFLSEKYDTTNSAEITNCLYVEYMQDLKDRSKALFPVDGTVWDASVSSEVAYVSVPETAQEVLDAASRLSASSAFQVKRSASTDRIYAMRSSIAFPISAYANCELYERDYFTNLQKDDKHPRHCYYGLGGSHLFNNWQKLPPLMPQSLIAGQKPDAMMELVNEALSLYQDGVRTGLIEGNRIRKISEDSGKNLKNAIDSANKAIRKAAENPSGSVVILNTAKDSLQKALDSLEREDTGYSLPSGSNASDVIRENIRKDYFVSSPAFHTLVRRGMEGIEEAEVVLAKIAKGIESAGAVDQALKNFSAALFLDVIRWKRMKVTFSKLEFGMETEVVLSDPMDSSFRYSSLPLYQAYLSYQELDSDIRAEIDQETQKRKSFEDDARIDDDIASINRYVERFTDSYNQAMLTAAEAYPEIQDEVKKLLIGVNRELKSLKAVAAIL